MSSELGARPVPRDGAISTAAVGVARPATVASREHLRVVTAGADAESLTARRPGDAADIRMRRRAADVLETVAIAHVTVPVAIALAATTGFALSVPMGAWVLLPALLVTALVIHVSCRDRRITARTLALVLAVHVAAGVVAASVPDGSWDGLSYQQEGVLRLAAGWNPLVEDGAPYGVGDPVFNNHYPKLSWIAGAVVLHATGRIEAGKLFNLTMMVAAAAQVVALVLRLTAAPIAVVLLLGGLVTLNPVAMSQAGTFYVDGWLGSTLTVLGAALVAFVATGRRSNLGVALVAAALAANLKFTGLVYAAVFVSAAVAATLLWRGVKSAVQLAGIAVACALVAVMVVGYSPYVRNVRDHGDPFFAAPRADVAGVRAANLNDLNRVERFLVSNFSPSSSTRGPDRSHLKFPFSIRRSEARALYAADLEIGGFGPLYGAALLISLVGAVVLGARRRTWPIATAVLVMLAALLASMFVHGETWWARYVPQAWLVPLVVAAAAWTSPQASATRWLGITIAAVLTVNVAIVAANVAWDELRYVRRNHAVMEQLAATDGPVRVYLSSFPPLRRRLSEAGVTFHVLEAPPAGPVRRHELAAPGHQAAWFD